MASWLVRLSTDQAVRVQALAEDTVVFLGKTLYSHSARSRVTSSILL